MSERPYGWGVINMMSADEALNGMTAAPAYYGAYPPGPGAGAVGAAASGGSPGAAPVQNSAFGMPGLLVWGFLFVALVLSHTFTFELQE